MTANTDPCFASKKAAFCLLVFALSFSALAALNVTALRFPTLHAEDGSLLLQRFFVAGSLDRVFETYNGYMTVMPNLVAWAVCRLPAESIPLGMVLAAMSLHAASTCCLVLAALQSRQRATLAFVVIALSALAIGTYALSCTLMYSQCSALMILVGLLCNATGARAGLGIALLTHLCVWSHPLAPVVVGLLAIRWWLSGDRVNKVFWASVIASATAYCFLGIDRLSAGTHTSGPLDCLSYVGVRGVMELVIPTSLKDAWYRPLPVVYSAIALAVAAGWVAWILAERRSTARTSRAAFSGSGVDLLVAFALPVVSVLARPGLVSPADQWGERYIHLTRCIILLGLWSWATHWTRLGKAAGGKLLWGVTVVYVSAMWYANRPFYTPDVADAHRVSQFMQTLTRLEASSADGRPGVRAFLERGDWDIRIQ